MQQAGISNAGTYLNQAAGGILFHHLWICHQQNLWDAAPPIVYTILTVNPTGALREAIGNSQNGVSLFSNIRDNLKNWDQLLVGVSELVAKYNTLRFLVEKAETTPAISKTVGTLVVQLSKSEAVGSCIEPKFVLERRETLMRLVGKDDFEAMIQRLVTTTDLVTVLLKTSFDPKNAVLYRAALSSVDDVQKKLVLDFVAAGLRGQSLEQWRAALVDGEKLLGLVILCVESGQEVSLGAEFHDALLEDAKNLVGRSEPSDTHPAQSGLLLKALRPEFRETYLRNLRDYLLDTAASDLTAVLGVYGEALIKEGVLSEEHKEDEIVRALLTETIKRKNQSELLWAAKVIRECPSILKGCRPASKEALLAQINLGENQSDPAALSVLSQIVDDLKK